ncbi:MAG: S8/S53 family peptidase [Actinomycetia bacterium]|nr:S8/S53 family peptidase [Actinomycetes bacterium]
MLRRWSCLLIAAALLAAACAPSAEAPPQIIPAAERGLTEPSHLARLGMVDDGIAAFGWAPVPGAEGYTLTIGERRTPIPVEFCSFSLCQFAIESGSGATEGLDLTVSAWSSTEGDGPAGSLTIDDPPPTRPEPDKRLDMFVLADRELLGGEKTGPVIELQAISPENADDRPGFERAFIEDDEVFLFSDDRPLMRFSGTGPVGDTARVAGDTRRLWHSDQLRLEEFATQTTGAGSVIAIVAGGIDPSHPSLVGGRVLGGVSIPGEFFDTGSLGTGVPMPLSTGMAVMAAGGSIEVGRVGVASDGGVWPVDIFNGADITTLAILSGGLLAAARSGADVIVVGVGTPIDDPIVRESVRLALGTGAIIVAPVGDSARAEGCPVSGYFEPGEVLYPAAYPGVIGVGSLDSDGNEWVCSHQGDHVDLLAPGRDLIVGGLRNDSPWRLGTGSAYAAALVGGIAAALVAADGEPIPSEVMERLLTQTANQGVIDPLAALEGLIGVDRSVSEGLLDPPSFEETTTTTTTVAG